VPGGVAGVLVDAGTLPRQRLRTEAHRLADTIPRTRFVVLVAPQRGIPMAGCSRKAIRGAELTQACSPEQH
jgi:hypothetical protein